MRQPRTDAGETLVEIIVTIIIVSVAVTALVASLGSAAGSAKAHRDNVLTDTVVRNFAEATKSAAESCTPGGSYSVSYSPPAGFSVSKSPASNTCPAVNTTQSLTLSITGPGGVVKTMQMMVRTP